MATKRKKPKLSAQDYWNTRLVEQEGLSKKAADDLWSTCSEDMRKELLPTLREEVTREVEQLENAVATDAEVAEYKRAVLCLETEARVAERAASNLLVELRRKRKIVGRVSSTVSCGLVFGFLPALMGVHWLGAAFDAFAFWSVAIPWAIAGIVSLVYLANGMDSSDERILVVQKYMTELGGIVWRARTARGGYPLKRCKREQLTASLVDVRREIGECRSTLGLTADYIDAARRQVRDQQIEQLDTEVLCRVDTEEAAPEATEDPEILDNGSAEALR